MMMMMETLYSLVVSSCCCSTRSKYNIPLGLFGNDDNKKDVSTGGGMFESNQNHGIVHQQKEEGKGGRFWHTFVLWKCWTKRDLAETAIGRRPDQSVDSTSITVYFQKGTYYFLPTGEEYTSQVDDTQSSKGDGLH
jgi:hypothetical protein